MDHSVASLEAKANVCCVKFNPQSRYHLAFGSAGESCLSPSCVRFHCLSRTKQNVFMMRFLADFLLFYIPSDHCVHYYDLRNSKQPLAVFKGHRKAVSYAKFVSGTEIVSA